MQQIDPLMPWQVWHLDSRHPRWTETLRDGTQVVIRPVSKDDAAEERAFIEALSPQSRRFRFLGQVRHPSDETIRQLTNMDYVHTLAFAAVACEDGQDRFVGVSRYGTTADGTDCEFAVTVRDDWQSKGLGTVLMKHLIEVAKGRGVKRMWSVDSVENLAMANLAGYLGFERRRDPDDASQVIHSLWL